MTKEDMILLAEFIAGYDVAGTPMSGGLGVGDLIPEEAWEVWIEGLIVQHDGKEVCILPDKSKGDLKIRTFIMKNRADISLLKDFEKILQFGGIFQDDGFTSCTTLEIGSTEDEIEIVVIVPKGKGHGAYIAPLSDFPEECEFVLNRGTIFKVRGIEEYEPKNFRVVIEVIGRSPEELF